MITLELPDGTMRPTPIADIDSIRVARGGTDLPELVRLGVIVTYTDGTRDAVVGTFVEVCAAIAAAAPEEVYDEEIAPLMAKILEICKRENMPMFASFAVKGEDGSVLGCSLLLAEEHDDGLNGYRNRLGLCLGIVRGHDGFDTAAGLMITRHRKPVDPDVPPPAP